MTCPHLAAINRQLSALAPSVLGCKLSCFSLHKHSGYYFKRSPVMSERPFQPKLWLQQSSCLLLVLEPGGWDRGEGCGYPIDPEHSLDFFSSYGQVVSFCVHCCPLHTETSLLTISATLIYVHRQILRLSPLSRFISEACDLSSSRSDCQGKTCFPYVVGLKSS